MITRKSSTPVIILSASEWQDNPVSTMHIAAELSKSRLVIFVETPGRRMPKLSEFGRVIGRIKRFLQGVKADVARGLERAGVVIVSPVAIPLPKFRAVRAINTFLLARQLKKVISKLSIHEPILWSFSPYWLPVVQKIAHQKLVFHCVDALHTYDDSEFFKRAYQSIVKQAATVFTPGTLIYQQLKQYNANTHLIGHGCSDMHLNFTSKPGMLAELQHVPRPIAIYAGCLANWVDYDLLIYAAQNLPAISFVLLGYVHGLAPQEKVKQLFALKNVYPFGYVDYKKLPEFYAEASVGIIPYKADNEHIYYCTPTKILDYFAARLPTVSTKYPAAQAMQDYLTIAESYAAFCAGIEELVGVSDQYKSHLYHYAKQHSWSQQVDKMLEVINVG